ncbi:conserved Plasmodium protein, unknown function [Plasmodium chabaudi chabaudi]|uniref:Uncharacterized protein n=1 Tax=Plasmodium chabaudi chabaudi TaxID=31271 RepID=A0A1D3LCL1_PLACU|nr:conserved Plasmodium protein, unknown function [Plasmodium chabaudi chabaudi]
MKECDEILELEEIQNKILNNNKKYDYEFLINIFLIFFHLFLYINIIGIYYTYNNETFKTCFNNSLSHIVQNGYFNINEIETIGKNLGTIKNICNYKKINYLKNIDDNFKFSLYLYNNHANTYIDYIIEFNRIFKSEIFKEERYLAISHNYVWTEWILYILFNAVTIFRIYRAWDIKKLDIYRTKKNLGNVAPIVIIALLNLNILYEQIIGSIYYESMQAKIFEGLIYIYNVFIILNIFNEISKIHKTFNIPIKIIQNSIKHNLSILIFLLGFFVLKIFNYFSSDGKSGSGFSLIDDLSDGEQVETEYISNFFFTIIYQYFIIPMIIILSTTTTFLLIHKNKHNFKERPINIPFLKTFKKYVPNEIDHNFNNIENVGIERDKEKVKFLKIVNLSLFFIFLILFIFNIILGRNYYPHVTEHFSGLLGESFASESKQGISFDTLTSQEEYYNFLNSVLLNNIMKNKKCIDNKKLYELESNITNSDIFLYENYFPVFPYDIYIKFGGTKKDDVTLESSLFFYNSGAAKAGLNQYKHLFDNSEENTQNYDTYSALYNFENDLLVLIKTSLNTHYNGQREQKKEIILYEIRNEKTSMDIIKMINLGILVVVVVAYFMLTIYLSYYYKINNIYMNCLLFSFFLIVFLFLLFNIMSYKSISHYNNYIEKIKNKNISTIYSMEELTKFRSAIQDLINKKFYTHYRNLFSYFIIIISILKIGFLFFTYYFFSFLKYKYYFLFTTLPIFSLVFFASILGPDGITHMSKNFLEWIMTFYHIKMSSTFSVYDILNDSLFYFFSFYMTSIYIYMFLKKCENIIKLKFEKKNEYSLHVDNLIIEDHDMQIYFKAIIYKIDKIFEKLRIIKEDNYISQTINQYIQFHNYVCQKNEILKKQDYIPYYDGSNNNKMVDTNLEEKQITDKKTSGEKIFNISATSQNGPPNYDVNTPSICETNEKRKSEDNTIQNTKEDFEKYEQAIIVEQIENMSLFFTKLLNTKYDFNFLSGDVEKCKTGNGQTLEKKKKKKNILENMIINLLSDLEYIEQIKTMYTYIVFLKIKKHILINSIQNFNSNKIELKEQYENKFIYQKHLVNLKKILNNEMQILKENICIQRDLKGSLVQIIEDECFYKKDTHEEK